MEELQQRLVEEAGLTEEQATKALETIKVYVTEKFPMLEGMLGNLLGGSN